MNAALRFSPQEDPSLTEGMDEGIIDVRTEAEARAVLKQLEKLPKDTVFGCDVEWRTPSEEQGQWKYEKKDGHLGCSVICWQLSAGDEYPELSKIFFRNWGPYAGHSLRVFKPWLESNQVLKTGHNFGSDTHVFGYHHINVGGFYADGMDLDWLLDEQLRENKHGLKECVIDHLGYDEEDCLSFNDTFAYLPGPKKSEKTGKWGKQPTKKVLPATGLIEVISKSAGTWYPEGGIARLANYACKDPLYSLRLLEFFKRKLAEIPWAGALSLWDYYEKFERPYWNTLRNCEKRGLPVNTKFLEELQEVITTETVQAEKKFFSAVVRALGTNKGLSDFNLGSGKQLQELFFIRLGFKPATFTKPSKTFPEGQPSVDDAALAALSSLHPEAKGVISPLQEYRSLTKLNSTYVKAFINKVAKSRDKRLHTSLRRTLTTGRLASSGPNLQTLPDPSKGTDAFGIRDSIEAPEGHVLVCGDLSQIEMRILAHVSKDPVLLSCFNSVPEIDTHCEAARGLHPSLAHLSDDEIKTNYKEIRGNCKVINFGIAYGISEYKLSADMKISVPEAEMIMKKYFHKYRGIQKWIHGTKQAAHANGHVRTFLRRYARCKGIRSSTFKKQKEMERAMVNVGIQGSAADLIMCSMIILDNTVPNPVGEEFAKIGGQLLMQVHDELLCIAPIKSEKRAQELVNEAMSNPYKYFNLRPLLCKTPADVGTGPTWYSAKH